MNRDLWVLLFCAVVMLVVLFTGAYKFCVYYAPILKERYRIKRIRAKRRKELKNRHR